MKKLFAFCILIFCLCLTGCGAELGHLLGSQIRAAVLPAPVPTASPEPLAVPTPTPTPTAAATAVDIKGKWQGHWEMFSCTGVWANFESYSWDCWAEIDDESILLWDVDIPKDTGLAKLNYARSDEGYNVKGGRFMNIESDYANWRLSLGQGDNGPELILRGSYEGDAEGRFSFAFYLEKDS